MGYFNYKRPAEGSYLDRRNPPYMTKKASLGSYRAHADVSASGDTYGGSRFNNVKDRLEDGSVLEDWIPRNPVGLHQMFRKIYLRDAIAGTVVDIFSTLPWGKYYELIGIDDPKLLQMYNDMLEALQVWSELPMISRELQIIGRTISSLNFNERKGHWDSLVAIDPDQARIEPVPLSGQKPLIDVLASPAWRNFARSVDPRIVEMKENMSPDLLQLLQSQSGYIPLDPMNTLWIARRVNQYDHIGTSVYTRILPAWAYETALWNSSLIAVRRRTRSILLLTAGIDESWEPTDEEVASLVNMFQQADEDPAGGVIGVRNGVEVSEVRDPGNVWGISQEYEFLSMIKMRALGVSEAYLSGETNVSNMEAARTSLGKQINSFKEHVLREIFQKQLFPTFARIHNMQKRTQAELNHNIRVSGHTKAYITAREAMNIPLSDLMIPQLITEDTLRPEQDSAYMDMLSTLADKGVPVPLRMWASAAGYDLDKAIAMMEENAVLQKRLNQLGVVQPDGGGAAVDFGSGDAGGGTDDLFGDTAGGGGEEPAPAAEPADSGEASPQSKSVLPPRWSAQASAAAWKNMKKSPLVKALSKIDPRILAEMQVPDSKVLVPYEED